MADDQYFKNETYTPQLADLPVKGSQKLINMFFLVDTSGSMRTDGRIRAINELFPQMILSLRKVQLEHMTEYDLRIAIPSYITRTPPNLCSPSRSRAEPSARHMIF